jgi:THO complex subunit 1
VQALIVLEFLLSLSLKAKEKLASIKTPNKSVVYTDQILSEEDTTWATGMKESIAGYLRMGADGPYFYRMVETVLARDKNWVRWKSEGCPSIEISSISPESFNDTKVTAKKLATNKRLRPTPMGSLNLGFLQGSDEALEKYSPPERYELPEVGTFKNKIAVDDLEIEMPTNNQTKAAAMESKSSKSWRALRIASKSRLAAFDRIENPDNIDAVFEEVPAEVEESVETSQEDVELPSDVTPIVIVDNGRSAFSSKSSNVVKLLLEKHPKVFSKVPAHTTRKAEEGEVNKVDFHFVEAQTFSMLRDGDQLLEFSDNNSGINYGTSRKTVEAISESGKIPVLDLDRSVSIFYVAPGECSSRDLLTQCNREFNS